MSINHGAGADGVGSATEPGPTVNVGDADSGLYANNKPKSQAENNAPSFERVCKLVQDAVDNIKFDARYGSPLADAPGVEEFRRQYYALMCQVRDGEYRAYIRKKLKVVWAWAGDHQPRRLRDQRGYSLILRDKIFEDGELRADQHRAAMNAAPSAVVEIEAPAASSATMEQPPPEPAGEERAPALQRNLVGHTVTPEDRLVGLIIRHRVPAADVPVAPEHFRNADLQYTWKRWERLGSEVDQLDVDAIRARIGHAWSVFTIWLIDIAGAPDPNNPIDPIREITALAEQIRSRTEQAAPLEAKADRAGPALHLVHGVAAPGIDEPLPPPAEALDLPKHPDPEPIADLNDKTPHNLEEPAPPEAPTAAAPTSPAQEEALPPTPAAPAISEEQPSLPLDRAAAVDIEARNLQAALDLAGAGIPVFPVRLTWNSKKQKWDKPPAIDGWQNAGTIDPEQIRAWWHDLPGALGVPSHYLSQASGARIRICVSSLLTRTATPAVRMVSRRSRRSSTRTGCQSGL